MLNVLNDWGLGPCQVTSTFRKNTFIQGAFLFKTSMYFVQQMLPFRFSFKWLGPGALSSRFDFYKGIQEIKLYILYNIVQNLRQLLSLFCHPIIWIFHKPIKSWTIQLYACRSLPVGKVHYVKDLQERSRA